MSTVAVAFENVSKHFGAVKANEDVNFSVAAGTIHGIIGENGAGKSTAMNILYGMYPPTGGSVRVHGKPVHFASPRDAMAEGVGMVHQHFMLADALSALDNILVGDERCESWSRFLPKALRPIDRDGVAREVEALATRYGFAIPLAKKAGELTVGEAQRVEILKVLWRDAGILILDEPTAVLTPQETDALFERLRELKAQGKTILIISHKLKEILAVTDNVTVFRAGRTVESFATAASTEHSLARAMVGTDVAMPAHVRRTPGDVVLEVAGLTSRGTKRETHALLDDVSFTLHAGEIVGVAGVSGNGQEPLFDVLTHPHEYFQPGLASGVYRLFHEDVRLTPAPVLRARGVGVMHPDRLRQDVVKGMDLTGNTLLGRQRHPDFQRSGWVRVAKLRETARALLGSSDVRAASIESPIETLSGGNQQKFVVGRELLGDPRLILAASPTRGVDIGAVAALHKRFFDAKERGAAILLFSTELDEVLALSDRILVMYRGRIQAVFSRAEATREKLGLAMGGHVAVGGDA